MTEEIDFEEILWDFTRGKCLLGVDLMLRMTTHSHICDNSLMNSILDAKG